MKNIKKIVRAHWFFIVTFVTTAFILLFRLGRNVLYDWDECIYAQYAKEMRTTGNWLTNQWNGLLGFEKPPMFTWLLQIPYSFGINEFNARILSVIFILLLLVVVYIFCNKFFTKRIAILTTLLLLASEVLIVFSIRNNTDIPYTFFIFIGFFFWVLSWKKSSYSYLSGLFFGLSVMTKGLSVAPYMAAVFLTIFLNFKKEKLFNFCKLLLVFVITILPWHLYQYVVHDGQFIKIYIFENLIQRANHPIEFHFGGPFYYPKLLVHELTPWIFAAAVLPLSYLFRFKKYLSFKKIYAELKDKKLLFTILLLIIIPFLAITRSQTKLPWYAMPFYPFLCIYLAYNFDFLLKKVKLNWLYYALVAFLILDAGRLLIGETRITQVKRDIPTRYDVLMKSKNFPQKTLYYLVSFSERQARAILTPELTTSTTFVYGGNPCSIYYSNKRVQYFYDPKEFVQQVKQQPGLYFIDNADLHFLEALKIKTAYKNRDFSLFEKK